jgi:hypothetical protein
LVWSNRLMPRSSARWTIPESVPSNAWNASGERTFERKPVLKYARKVLDKTWRKAAYYGKRLDRLTDDEHHEAQGAKRTALPGGIFLRAL